MQSDALVGVPIAFIGGHDVGSKVCLIGEIVLQMFEFRFCEEVKCFICLRLREDFVERGTRLTFYFS